MIAAILALQVSLGYCDDSEEVSVNARQYNCPYMWMKMNSGPQVTGLSPWLLLCLGIAVLLLSTDITSLSSRGNAVKYQ